MKFPLHYGLVLALAFVLTSLATPLIAAETKVGPTNGRLLTSAEPHVEFLVNAEKKVELRFVDKGGKIVPPGEQEITVLLGERSKPTKLTFSKEEDKLVSDKEIPEGNNYPTVVQIREKAGAKPVNERFNLNQTVCSGCSNPEYSCKCGH